MSETQVAMARAMLADRDTPVQAVCDALRVSRATLYRYLAAGKRRTGALDGAAGPGARP